jgi:SNF2 family DNA or RNA helicase
VDEGHRLKRGSQGKLFQMLAQLRARNRVLLTGTPLQNSLDELFFLLHFLEPERFDSLDAFTEEFKSLDKEEHVHKVSELTATRARAQGG